MVEIRSCCLRRGSICLALCTGMRSVAMKEVTSEIMMPMAEMSTGTSMCDQEEYNWGDWLESGGETLLILVLQGAITLAFFQSRSDCLEWAAARVGEDKVKKFLHLPNFRVRQF